MSAKPSFEESLTKLTQRVQKLESGELSLEDSLTCFEEGVKLTQECQAQLSSAEQKIELLTKVSPEGKPELQPF